MAAKARNQSSKKLSIPCRRTSPESPGITPATYRLETIPINPCYKILTRNVLRDEFWLILLKCECNFTLTTLFVNFRRQGFLPACRALSHTVSGRKTAPRYDAGLHRRRHPSGVRHSRKASAWRRSAAPAGLTSARKQTVIHAHPMIVAPWPTDGAPDRPACAGTSQAKHMPSSGPLGSSRLAHKNDAVGRSMPAQELPR